MLTISLISLSKPVDPNLLNEKDGEVTKKVVQPLKSSYFRAKIIPFSIYGLQCQFSVTQKAIKDQTNQYEYKIRYHQRTQKPTR